MNNYIYSNPSKQTKGSEKDKYYSIIQDYDFMDDDNNPRVESESDKRVLAKTKYKPNGQPKYLIRIDNYKKLYNPSSPLSENKQNKLLDQYKADASAFKEVSQKVFDYYLTFLKTSNPSWIHNAEREDF